MKKTTEKFKLPEIKRAACKPTVSRAVIKKAVASVISERLAAAKVTK